MPSRRRLFGLQVGRLGGQRGRGLGRGGTKGGICHPLPIRASSGPRVHHSPFLFSSVHQGESSGERGAGSSAKLSTGVGIFKSRVLQPCICGTKCQQEVLEVCLGGQDLAVSGAVFRPDHSTSGIHENHGPDISLDASPGLQNGKIFRRLASNGVVVRRGDPREGHITLLMQRFRHKDKCQKEQSDPISDSNLFRNGNKFQDSQGISHDQENFRIPSPTSRIRVLPSSTSMSVEKPLREDGISLPISPRIPASDEVSSTLSQEILGFSGQGGFDSLG